MEADKQFEVIQDELDRFEQEGLGEDEVKDAHHYQGELSDCRVSQQESSCSFEDFDTEVVREMGLSPTRDDIGANSDDEMFVARGRRHVDSLKTSTVFDELADGMSPGGCSLLDESPIIGKTRRQGGVSASTKETALTKGTISQRRQTTASGKSNNIMITSMMDQLSVLKDQLRKFEQNLEGRQEVTTFGASRAASEAVLIKETRNSNEEKKETLHRGCHKRQMTLNELEESKVVENHYSSESEIDPATWIGLRHGPSTQAACVTKHQYCDQALPVSGDGDPRVAKPIDRPCRQKQKKKTTKRRRSSSKKSCSKSKSRSNSRPKSRTTLSVQESQHRSYNWYQQQQQEASGDRNISPQMASLLNPFGYYPIANKGYSHHGYQSQQPEMIMTPYLMSAQQSSAHGASVTSLTTTQRQSQNQQMQQAALAQQFFSPAPSQQQQPFSVRSSIQYVSPHSQQPAQQLDTMQSVQKAPSQAMVVPCSSQPNHVADFFQQECQKYEQKIEKLKKQVARQKATISDKDKIVLKQGKVYKEMRTVREKLKVSEKERLEQERMVSDLKQHLAETAKENLALKRRLYKKETGPRRQSAGKVVGGGTRNLISEPISASGWISPIDQSFTPIRHVVLSKNGKVVPQDLLFD